MKKKTVLSSTIAVLILLLSACGEKGDRSIDEPQETEITAAVEKHTVL